MGNQQGTIAVTDIELGWLAGVIDGEGTIAFSVYTQRAHGKILNEVKVKPQIIVTNTEKVLVEKVVALFGCCAVGALFQTRQQHGRSFAKKTKYKPLHVAYVCGFKRVKKALELIGHHLVSKKTKADLVLRYIRQRELKLSTDNKAPLDAADLRLILEILHFSAAHNAKGPVSKHFAWIDGLLNEHERRGDRKVA